MTISEVLEFVDDIKPNAYSVGQKMQWINEAEGMVQTEVFLRDISEITVYTEEDTEDTLLVRPPHDKLYIAYLSAMIDFANGEYERYQNSMAMFNSHYNEFVRWFASIYRPADHGRGRAVYYLTAYGIAVKHGYTGTEEEWLLSLKGEKGDGFKILGYYPTLEALTEAVTEPETGDAYGVGTQCPYDIYVWAEEWVNNGKIGIDVHNTLSGRDEDDAHPISAITGLTDTLDELFTSVSNGKSEIASAITDKGVPVEEDASFHEMAEAIEDITGGEYDIIQYIDGDTSSLAIRDAGGEGVILATKTVTENGTYNAADDDVDGYSEVTVDVAGAPPSVIMSGDTPVAVLPINITVKTTTYTKLGKNSLIIKKAGKYRLKWYTVRASASSGTAYTLVYINGEPQGTAISTAGSAPKAATLNVNCQAGDVIEVYGRSSATTVSTWCSDLTACIAWDNGF